jgi:biopolymer transport protein ExbB/TolQ
MDPKVGGLIFSIQNSTFEGRITLVVLVVFSLISWTVIISKFRQLRKARKQTARFLTAYSAGDSPLDVFEKEVRFEGSPLYHVYVASCDEIQKQSSKHRGKIPSHGMNAIRISMERGMGEAVVALEKGMIILGTAISGGPFIGLLGTVWGVMDTFSGVARVQQASMTAMAPGVAAALINTVVGLLVAIPALFAYNFLVTKLRGITIEMDNFSAHLENVFSTEYQQSRNGGDKVPFSEGIGDEERETDQRETYPLTGSARPGTV